MSQYFSPINSVLLGLGIIAMFSGSGIFMLIMLFSISLFCVYKILGTEITWMYLFFLGLLTLLMGTVGLLVAIISSYILNMSEGNVIKNLTSNK